MITIYQLMDQGKKNSLFPDDFRKVFHVHTNIPDIAFSATNDRIDTHGVVILDYSCHRSTSVGDVMVIDRCVVLLVESVGYSYQGDLRVEEMASHSLRIQSIRG